MIKYFFALIGLISIYFTFKNKFFSYRKNSKIKNFKDNFINKEVKIEKIFLRNNEKLISDPNINIVISLYEKESQITQKTNIHRARLAKFKKSKINGEFIYKDSKGNIYKIINENKVYI